jgi:transcriptional regulator with XRE-family HTH domain
MNNITINTEIAYQVELKKLLQDIGRQVKERRTEKQWTQEDLSEAPGLERTMISKLETGKLENPTIETLWCLMRAMNLNIGLKRANWGGPTVAAAHK